MGALLTERSKENYRLILAETTTPMLEKIQKYVAENENRFVEELQELLRIPSISADSAYEKDVLKAAEYLQAEFERLKLDKVQLLETGGYPAVYAEKIIDPQLPTVLVYGHYDVQPPDPLELWETPPFEPRIHDGKIYARGACDDKGQMYMHLKAVDTLLNTGGLACNVKFFIEGEEEVGSEHLADAIKANTELLSCDAIVISDTSMIANDVPSITVGLRGLAYMQVEVTGPNRDLHSGTYGGAVGNPINTLCEMIASLKDEHGHINIPGFYEDIDELSEEAKKEISSIPFDEKAFKEHLEVEALYPEDGYNPSEQLRIRPTLDVNGIWGGYIGEGAKTVLPSKAYAKISMRLVPSQDPKKIAELFKRHFESIAPDWVKVQVEEHHGGDPFLTNTDSNAYRAAEKAYTDTFGVRPIASREGGSIPITALFSEELQAPVVLMGFGLDSDAIHSPNEHFGLFNFRRGIETISLFHHHFRNEAGK